MSELDINGIRRQLERMDRTRYVLMFGSQTSGTGASAASSMVVGIVPWNKWRVVNCGFFCVAAGASTVAEKVSIGIYTSDIGTTDTDYFGQWTQDSTAGENWAIGDMFQRVNMTEILQTPDDPANAGTHPVAAGSPDGLNVWQTKQAVLTYTKENVGSSTATVIGWIIIELGDELYVRG